MQKTRIYVRVSTEEQDLQRQLESTSEYAQNRLGKDATDFEVYRDKSTGTNTDREGYQQLLEDLNEGDTIVVNSVSRIARSIRDLSSTIDTIEQKGANLHIVQEGLEIKPDDSDPYQEALLQLLGVFSELEAKMTRERIRDGIQSRQNEDDYHHGRAPLGFESDSGHLYPAKNHDRVCETLELVLENELSKRKASKELDTSRATINRALERKELYGL